MSKINLRGIIVSSNYDLDWYQDYIAKGIIIPESSFRAALAEASRTETLTVYVNSPGGSVFAANEMVNAVREWQAETKQSVHVVAGALVASAASAFTIMVGDRIRAHQNSKMMFHGAWGEMVGGSEAMADYAELLEKINADIKVRLVSKYELSPDVVDEWFAEGRAGWLTAREMKAVGLADEIIGEDAEVIEFPAEAVDKLQSRGLKVAALLTEDNTGVLALNLEAKDGSESTAGDGVEPGANQGADAGAGAGDGQTKGDETADEGKGDVAAPAATTVADSERIAQLVEAAVAERLGERAEELDQARATIEKQKTLISGLQSKADKLDARVQELTKDFEQRIVDLRSSLEKANDRLAKFSLGSLTFSPEQDDLTWEQALAESKGDYAEARRKHPALYAAYRAAQKAARK